MSNSHSLVSQTKSRTEQMSDRLTTERPIISMQSVSSVHAKRVEYPPIISKARPELLTVPVATDKRRVEGRIFGRWNFEKQKKLTRTKARENGAPVFDPAKPPPFDFPILPPSPPPSR